MIKKVINHLKSLSMDITPWMENNFHSIKEKIYNGRKIILIIEKDKTDNYIGKFMIMNYKKELILGDEDITWRYEPHMIYKTKVMFSISADNETVKQKIESLFQEVFLEKKIKLKFTK